MTSPTRPTNNGTPVANPEAQRLGAEQAQVGSPAWKRWGPYLAERAWGTVREDYSAEGDAWNSFPHDHSRSRAYRWNEDGLLGISDDQGQLCLALALWNGQDPVLKERLYGLTGEEGNHGEDVKEYYAYLDSTPTHSYMRALYKYPQAAFPYQQLIEGNRARGKDEPEYELLDTGVFDQNAYWDIEVEYAKASPDDVLMQITLRNRGEASAQLHVLPTLWFRNTWSWGHADAPRPRLHPEGSWRLRADHPGLGPRWLHYGDPRGAGALDQPLEVLLCENETNHARLSGTENASSTAKDGLNDFVVHGETGAVGREVGSKGAVHFVLTVPAGESRQLRVRLSDAASPDAFSDFGEILAIRQAEADLFYEDLQPASLTDDQKNVQRQAFAGMLWSKQFYFYDVQQWLRGDPAGPPPPLERTRGRNRDWHTLTNADVLSMPDTWEYPWFAAWDLAFHAIALAVIDPAFAKRQLELLTREWYQHPNGQIPAYEWSFSDVNPPVHAWAAWRVYQIEKKRCGQADRLFLERVFHKLLLNFTWWVNRKDAEGRNVFQGGFLGLDNISVFDRSAPLPGGGHLEQADGTAWMGMFCLNMLKISLELAQDNPAYEDIASKFFEHFLYIARALNALGDDQISLWDDEDEFYYDQLQRPGNDCTRLKVRSMVGLIPLLAVETLEPGDLEKVPNFKRRAEWFLKHRPELAGLISHWNEPGLGDRRLLALARGHRMKRVLARMLDEDEFLSAGGIRSVSRFHLEHPFELHTEQGVSRIGYEPAESRSGLFGGNSNWRGPVWFPINYLLIESLQKFQHYYGDDFLVEYPSRSGEKHTLGGVADGLSQRLIGMFTKDAAGRRPVFGDQERFQTDPHWRDLIPFHEYFHGDTAAGLGASHQTGWTGLVAKLLQQQGHRQTRATQAQDPAHAQDPAQVQGQVQPPPAADD